MNVNSNSMIETPPVPQDNLPAADMDVWEPPFERWMRIADSALASIPGGYCDTYRKSPRLVRIPKA